jgi:LPXTG-motif cell wall-anchored protein
VATAALLFTGVACPARADDTPLCRVEVLLPERGWVGEQLGWELRVTRRRDVEEVAWETPPAFPGFRAEWLPGGHGGATAAGDESYELTTERRALFPAHEGTLAIPDAALLCRVGEREERVRVPGGAVLALSPPSDARPEAWDGLVGPVAIDLNVGPERVAVGSNLRLSVMLRGPGNLWHVDDLLGDAYAGRAIDVFPGRPELARDAGRRLTWRRYLSYDLVPRSPGPLTVPALEVVTFDPETARYVRVATEPRVIVVAEAAPGNGSTDATLATGAIQGSTAARPAVEEAGGRTWLAWAGALLLLAGVGGWLVRRRRSAPSAVDSATLPPAEAVRTALVEATAAERTGDVHGALGALARGLRGALADALPGAGARSTEEMLHAGADASTRALVELLVRVERLRYDADAAPAELRALMAELTALLPAAPHG